MEALAVGIGMIVLAFVVWFVMASVTVAPFWLGSKVVEAVKEQKASQVSWKEIRRDEDEDDRLARLMSEEREAREAEEALKARIAKEAARLREVRRTKEALKARTHGKFATVRPAERGSKPDMPAGMLRTKIPMPGTRSDGTY